MNHPLLLKGGRLIDPSRKIDAVGDLLIAKGVVIEFLPPGKITGPEGTETIDCAGLWVTPGLIDMHVHLRDPGFPHKETIASGLAAAAAGGFTSVAAMANTSPANDSPVITYYMLDQAAKVNGVRLLPVSAVTKGLAGNELVDFPAMAEAGAKLFSDDGMPIDREEILTDALRIAARTGLALSLHEEDRGLTGHGACHAGPIADRLGVAGIPRAAETSRVKRDLAIAREAQAPLHIAHAATAESLALIRAARRDGLEVTCEATPHHFSLTDEAFGQWGPYAKMAPPLRSAHDLEAVAEALADGTIDAIATDHAPHDRSSKQMNRLARLFDGMHRAQRLRPADAATLAGAANGIIGLETALGLALQLFHRGVVDAARLVTLMSSNPARLLRCAGGTLAAGSPADITVIDSALQWTVEPMVFRSLSRNTPFGGIELKGAAVMTIVEGRMVYSQGARSEYTTSSFVN